MEGEDPAFVRARHVAEINVKHLEDKCDCDITGSVMIDSNRIAVTDRNNSSIKLVNVDSNSILSYLNLSTEPFDVTYINNSSQLVITCKNKLVFVHVGETLTVNKELQLHGSCKGIIYHDNNLFVSFDEPKPAVELIDLDGKPLRTFSIDQHGQPLFDRPLYICLNRSKSTLYVSDLLINTVKSVDLRVHDNVEIQNVYKDTNLKFPRGLTVDINDNIYIAGCASHNIHQISTQCTRIQILLGEAQGTDDPMSVTYCETENKLYISHNHGYRSKRNVLSVYQLQ